MINTLYSKDISRKVSTALKAQMESGEFKKRNLPYGCLLYTSLIAELL